jgi:hypothetical protein
MRLIRYINERKKFEDYYKTPPVKKKATALETERIVELIRKECKPFLKEVKGGFDLMANPLFRGMKSGPKIYGIMKGTRPSDRTPKFTAKEVFEIFDKTFADEFGWWVRSKGVFTGDKGTADGYGRPYLFFPMGNYKYVWSENYASVWRNLTRPDKFSNLSDTDKRTWLIHIEEEAKKAVKYYTDTGLSKAVKGHAFYEAVFQVKKYIVINFPYYIKIADILNNT